jgi:PPM family protein phosphatase
LSAWIELLNTPMAADESSKPADWFARSPLWGPRDSPPPSAQVHVDFGAHSRRGRHRSANEDHYLVVRLGRYQETLLTSLPEQALTKRFDEFAYGMVVADGMGGTGAGEAASRLAVATLANLAIAFGKWNVRIDEAIASEVMERAERFYLGVDAVLLQASRIGQLPLQSTLTAVFTAGAELFFAHVGHSRAFLFRNGVLLRLTRDHTLARERSKSAPLVDVALCPPDLHHVVTEVMGTAVPGGPRIDIERCGLVDGDVVLLCTNGLTDSLHDAQIVGVLGRDGSPDDQCRALVDLAVSAAGDDDVTALVARYRL